MTQDHRSNMEKLQDAVRALRELSRKGRLTVGPDPWIGMAIKIGGRDPVTVAAELAAALSNPNVTEVFLEPMPGQTEQLGMADLTDYIREWFVDSMREGYATIGDVPVSQGEWNQILDDAGVFVSIFDRIIQEDVAPAPPPPDYLRHDPTKNPKRARRAKRGGPRYCRKGFFG